MGIAQDIEDQFDEDAGRQTLSFPGASHNEFAHTIIPYTVGFVGATIGDKQEYGVVDLEYIDKKITVAPVCDQ